MSLVRSRSLGICELIPGNENLEPPIETETEREYDVDDVNIYGDIEAKNLDNGLNARGMMQNMRRGTDSHKTE